MIEVAIVGGGPAGSHCAESLAENGIYPVIFDHTHPREKPCGGLVSPLAQRFFPFLKRLPIRHSSKSRLHLIYPNGRDLCISTRESLLGFSRLKLDQFLVNMAVDKGVKLVKEKVMALERKKDFWNIKTTHGVYNAKILIGADGVNSLARRKIIGPLKKRDKGVCCGYFVRGLEEEDVIIKFLVHRKGYIWVIPRDDHTSLGIGASEASRSYGLRQELNAFIKERYPHAEKISRWTALIPNIKNFRTFQIPIAGPDWILIGDAAGHVSPFSGEGIAYALLDGELAAQAVVENKPDMFNKLWKEAYGTSLLIDSERRKWVYTRPGIEIHSMFLRSQLMLTGIL